MKKKKLFEPEMKITIEQSKTKNRKKGRGRFLKTCIDILLRISQNEIFRNGEKEK